MIFKPNLTLAGHMYKSIYVFLFLYIVIYTMCNFEQEMQNRFHYISLF